MNTEETDFVHFLLNRLSANRYNFVTERYTWFGPLCTTCGCETLVEEIDFEKLKEEIDKFSKEFQKQVI